MRMMYHIANCVAAAITSKNKGVFMSSLTDLVFINVLPSFLPHSFQTTLPQFEKVLQRPQQLLLHLSATLQHTHTHSVQWASQKCVMYSPRLDEAHGRTFIPTSVHFFFSPSAIYTVEKVNCLKHRRCYFS